MFTHCLKPILDCVNYIHTYYEDMKQKYIQYNVTLKDIK
jgi:hypothetical protein